MSVVRWDALHSRWVLFSRKRQFRPGGDASHFVSSDTTPLQCPFCPGHENQTPPPTYVDREAGLTDAPWSVRVFPNLYEAVNSSDCDAESAGGPFAETAAYGVHEVIVEHPVHDRNPGEFEDDEMLAVLQAYRERLVDLRSDKRLGYALIFKNYGRPAGASLEHPHSQLIALPFVPPGIESEMRAATGEGEGGCYFCQVLERDGSGERAVLRRDGFFAWSPWAAGLPYELLLFPEAHDSDFVHLPDAALLGAARMLRDCLGALSKIAGDVPYNLMLHVSPWRPANLSGAAHWHFALLPRMNKLAGFEIATGSRINPVMPEEAARLYRQALAG